MYCAFGMIDGRLNVIANGETSQEAHDQAQRSITERAVNVIMLEITTVETFIEILLIPEQVASSIIAAAREKATEERGKHHGPGQIIEKMARSNAVIYLHSHQLFQQQYEKKQAYIYLYASHYIECITSKK